ncbi:MAG: PAS domain S-box protein [Dissulfurispiraceae bacterium]
MYTEIQGTIKPSAQSFRFAEPAARVRYSFILLFAILSAGIIAVGYLCYRGPEVYAPVSGQLRLVLWLVLSLLFVAGAGLAYVWRQQSIGLRQEQYRASEALANSEILLNSIVQTASDGIISANSQEKIVLWNKGAEQIFGYSADEVSGKDMSFIVPQRYLAAHQQAINDLMAPGNSKTLELAGLKKDGSEFPLELTVAKCETTEGVFFTCILRDIAASKHTEKDLRESEERFRNAFEHAAIGFAICMLHGRFLRVNQAMCKMLGYSAEELMTRTFQDITYQDDLGFNMDQINQLISGKLPVVHFQKRYIHKLGHEVWASLSVSVVRDDKGNPLHLVSLVEDLTEKRKLEDQLRQSQKMEAIGQLAGGVAHDFNNILTTIMGYGGFALMSMSKDDPQRRNIEHMLEGAERAAHLTSDLLLFSRKQISEKKLVDMNEIIKKMETFLTKIIGEDISYKTTLHPGAIPVLANAHQLEQVMMNLATNARDAMPKGGVFSVTTGQISLDKEFITAGQIRFDKEFITAHGYGQPGTYAFITVSDTGKGMDEETRQRIFEPFFTTKEMGRGTGLGMAVVYGIVKGHDGYINVYSQPGLGTTFRIYLPLTTTDAEVTQESIQPLALSKGETIIIAEDEPEVREVLRISLEEYGYIVIEAENGEEAVKQYRENMEKVSLVLLDMIMPLKNGREAYDEIKSLRPDIKVIFISGYTEDIIMGKGLLKSDTELIPKPISPDSLLRKVREVLDR